MSRRLSTPSFRSASVFLFPNFILVFFLCHAPKVLGFWKCINFHALYFLYSHVSHWSNMSIYVLFKVWIYLFEISQFIRPNLLNRKKFETDIISITDYFPRDQPYRFVWSKLWPSCIKRTSMHLKQTLRSADSQPAEIKQSRKVHFLQVTL